MTTLRRNPRLTAMMPALSGGLNLAAGDAHIADTELADGDNLLYEQGCLRARDGWVAGANARYPVAEYTRESRHFTHRGRVWWWEATALAKNGAAYTRFTLYECRRPDYRPVERFSHDCEDGTATGLCVPSGGERREDLFLLYFSDGTVFTAGEGDPQELTDRVYRPLCRINGTPSTQKGGTLSGVAVEGRNRLTPQFRLCFTADGTGVYYRLPDDATALSATVDGVTYPLGDESQAYALRSERGVCWFEQAGLAVAMPPSSHNGVVITASGDATPHPVHEQRYGCWFGGGGNTLDGTRLFLAGAGDTAIYSAAADPLYFPDSCYLTVGAVTALARQGDDLIVFTDRALYAVAYEAGGTLSADAVQSGLISDLHAAVAVFPVTTVDDTRGCDLPDTVASLDGRLVWACRDGAVCTLNGPTSAAPYRVNALNRAVLPAFLNEPTRAVGGVVRSRYYLLWEETLWLYDDGTWWRWSWPQNGATPTAVLCTDEVTVLGEDGVCRYLFLQGGDDQTVAGEPMPVVARMRTKSFDFGTPETYKAVTAVAAEVSGAAILPRYHTERGVLADRPHTPDGGGLLTLSPSLSRLRRFSLELSGERLTVGAVSVTVKGEMR